MAVMIRERLKFLSSSNVIVHACTVQRICSIKTKIYLKILHTEGRKFINLESGHIQ